VQRVAANHCELDRKACPIVDLQAGFSAMLLAGNGHRTRLRWDVGSIPKPESNPCLHGSSNGGLGGCVIVGGGVGEPPNRQCTALLNQGIDLLNHDIASKTLSGVKLELCTPWRAVVLSGPNAPFGLREFPGSLQPYIHQTPLVIHRVATP